MDPNPMHPCLVKKFREGFVFLLRRLPNLGNIRDVRTLATFRAEFSIVLNLLVHTHFMFIFKPHDTRFVLTQAGFLHSCVVQIGERNVTMYSKLSLQPPLLIPYSLPLYFVSVEHVCRLDAV